MKERPWAHWLKKKKKLPPDSSKYITRQQMLPILSIDIPEIRVKAVANTPFRKLFTKACSHGTGSENILQNQTAAQQGFGRHTNVQVWIWLIWFLRTSRKSTGECVHSRVNITHTYALVLFLLTTHTVNKNTRKRAGCFKRFSKTFNSCTWF